ncbi:hypothetical protein GJU40_08490 [Bacillus lacus]|uniref:YviE n=1 Tax=Metabacillus lacus TaxID=1983721 RepID=A0A7X2LYU1_9BACI|nr:DUF6470 family protein [Metabacillus lacus]MRX72188.1 hypothetical protein [Metabacillus lacus]
MNIPSIRIESTRAQLGMKTLPPQMEQEQRPADVSIQQPSAEVTMETTPSVLNIDQSKAREDMDLKSIGRRIEEFAQRGYQDWLQGMERLSIQGDQLMKIEGGGSPIADQAIENSGSPQYEFNIGFVPSHGSVQITYQPSQLKIEVNPRKPIIEVQQNKPQLVYQAGKVQFEMLQHPQLEIDFINYKA